MSAPGGFFGMATAFSLPDFPKGDSHIANPHVCTVNLEQVTALSKLGIKVILLLAPL